MAPAIPPNLNLQEEVLKLRARVTELEEEREGARRRAEEQDREALVAKEERDRLLALIGGIGDEVWFADVHKRFTLVNRSAAREFNLGGGDLDAESFQASLDVRRADGAPRPVEETPALRALRGETVRNEESIIRTPHSGQMRWRQESAWPVRDESGAIAGSVCVVRDITELKRAEEALRESEVRFRSLAEECPAIIWVTDAEGNNRFVNRAYREFFGVAAEDVEGQGWRPLVHPEDEAGYVGAVVRATRERAPFKAEARVRRSDGEWRWIESYGEARHSAAGFRGFAGVSTDITERKLVEAALRESEERLRLTLEAAQIGTFEYWPETGKLVSDEQNRRLWGLRPGEEWSYADAIRRIHPEDRARVEGVVRAALDPAAEGSYECDYRTLAADGAVRWTAARGRVYFEGEEGNRRAVRMVGIQRDITARYRSEEKLRESEARFRSVLEGSRDVIYRFNIRTGHFEYISPSAETVVGYKVEKLMAQDSEGALAMVHPEDQPAMREAWQRLGETGKAEAEYRQISEGGEYRWLSNQMSLTSDSAGRPLYRDGSIRDITKRKQAEATIQRLASLPQQNPSPVLRVTCDHRLELANAAGRRWLLAMGMAAEGQLPPAALALADRAIGERRIAEQEIGCEDGRTFLFAAAQPPGELYVNLYGMDITDRKKAEEALRRSEKIYRAVGESLRYGVWVCDPDGRNTYTSESFLQMTGLTQDQFSHVAWKDILPPEDAERVMAAWAECVRTEGRWEIEHSVRGGDGKLYPVLARGVPVRDEQGKIICWAGINLDISHLKRAQEEIRRSHAILEAFFDASPGILNIQDEELRYVKTDGVTPIYFGLTRESIRGKSAAELAPEYVREYGPMMREVIETGQARLNVEVRIPSPWPGGKTAQWVVSYFPVPLPEGKRGIGLVGVEVTEIRQAEERLRQAQKLESLGLLAGGVAHDFNNLLVGVIGAASLAQDMLPQGHPASEMLETVVKAGEQAAHLTRQMLAYAGKGKFIIERLDISVVTREILELVRPSIPKKVTLKLELGDGLPKVEADRGQIQQIVMNLVINATEAIGSHDGLVTVRTGTRAVDERFTRSSEDAAHLTPGEYVVFEVQDNGCGMGEAVKSRIFDPFYSTKFTGRGLGLAAVAGIVRGHKGAILVESSPGKGSTFAVLLPAAARLADGAPEAPARTAARGSGVILVIDDERVVREMARRGLERSGYTVLVAEGGLAAVEILKRLRGEIALAVLDLSMPGMNGEETLPELRKIQPELKVLVSSGYSQAEAMSMFAGHEVSGFIQKPYFSAKLAELVKRALE